MKECLIIGWLLVGCVGLGNAQQTDSVETLDGFRLGANGKGKLELFTEDLSWNKCAKLTAGPVHDEKCSGQLRKVSSASACLAWPCEPDMYYDFAFELKGTPKKVIYHFYEISEVDGREVRKKTRKDVSVAPGKDWRRFTGHYRTGAKARRVELCILLWSLEDIDAPDFQPGEFVLIDNVSFVRSESFARMQAMLADGKTPLRVAPFPVDTDPACPFLPIELADEPTQIVIRVAVNEQKAVPLAIGNMTTIFGQYRVRLETSFPANKIKVREALRYKDTEEPPVSVRFDPLVDVNGASVVSVPPKEAGAVWYDFDTTGVKPGSYAGCLSVIPLNGSWPNAAKKIPLTVTVDPIVLPREAVRPAHFCSPCTSDEGFALEADAGARIYAIETSLFRPEAVGNPNSPARKKLFAYQRRAKERGVAITYFVKYDALRESQRIFNPTKDPARKWPAWEQYLDTLAKVMDEAGVPFEQYYVLIRDEPFNNELEWIREAHRRLKARYPKMRTYVSVCERIDGPIDFLDCLGDTTDLWSLTSRMYHSDKMVARLQALKGKFGTKLMHYLCNTSVKESLPGYFHRHCWRGEYWGLDADMLYHFTEWHDGRYGTMGFLRVPEGEISYQADGRTFPSVRYMAYREGVTDIKYVQALREKRGDDPKIREFLRKAAQALVVGDDGSIELPIKIRERIRQLLLQ